MKAIVCEMCGSHDVVKKEGLYICRSCDTKYSTEDAKKLMVEISGNVDISGSTVKIDNTESTEKFLQLARRAREDGNSANAAKYYEMVNISRPDDWESSFYSVYYEARCCKIGQIDSAAGKVYNCLPVVMSLIKNNVTQSQQKSIYVEIVKDIIELKNMFVKAASDHAMKYSSVQGTASELKSRTAHSYNMLKVAADCIWNEFKDKETAISLYEACIGTLDVTVINERIKNIDPSRGAEKWKEQNKKVRNNMIAYLVLAVICVALSPSLLGAVAWVGYVAGGFFGIMGLGFLFTYFHNKKNYID